MILKTAGVKTVDARLVAASEIAGSDEKYLGKNFAQKPIERWDRLPR
jgi:hypothetical protein